jgi:hypothetical protein
MTPQEAQEKMIADELRKMWDNLLQYAKSADTPEWDKKMFRTLHDELAKKMARLDIPFILDNGIDPVGRFIDEKAREWRDE